MKAKLVTVTNGQKHIHSNEFDADDALSSVKQMLKLGKIEKAYIQIINGRFSYRVTKVGNNIQLKSFAQPTI